jgi:hypothetical protein
VTVKEKEKAGRGSLVMGMGVTMVMMMSVMRKREVRLVMVEHAEAKYREVARKGRVCLLKRGLLPDRSN